MSQKFLFLFLAIVLAGFAVFKILFSPVSITFESRPGKIFSNSSSPITVEMFAVNRLDFKIPFKHLYGKFVIGEGGEKIDIVQEKEDELLFRTRNDTGRLVIFFYAKNVPFPVEIILNIESASLAANKSRQFPLTEDSNA